MSRIQLSGECDKRAKRLAEISGHSNLSAFFCQFLMRYEADWERLWGDNNPLPTIIDAPISHSPPESSLDDPIPGF